MSDLATAADNMSPASVAQRSVEYPASRWMQVKSVEQSGSPLRGSLSARPHPAATVGLRGVSSSGTVCDLEIAIMRLWLYCKA